MIGAPITRQIYLIKQKLAKIFSKIKETLRSNSKFTIHPFASLHKHLLLPLSIKDYVARFSLELVVLMVATITVIANFSIKNHDESVIFSYITKYPHLNPALADAQTITILAQSDVQAYGLNATEAILATSTPNRELTNRITIQEDSILKTNPADPDTFLSHGRTVYDVKPGDSIVSVASSFGISPQTIMLENKLDETSILKIGQQLTILPTTGVSHKVLINETTESIAAKYKVNEDDLLDANDLELPDDLAVGDVMVIPLAKVELPKKPAPRFVTDTSNQVALRQVPLPASFVGGISFIWPTAVRSISQTFWRRHSGIDISNSQKVPIYASEDGFVEVSGYQKGYGNTIVLNHGNGFQTRYGHASELYVSAGAQVSKGQVIAKQGRSGRVRGATGIHLHFEIIKNGVKVNPLSYVRP